MKQRNVRMSDELYRRLEKAAQKREMDVAQLRRFIYSEWLKKNEPEDSRRQK